MEGKVSHQDYYTSFVTPEVLDLVSKQIGAYRIATSTDSHFNDIPLNSWDRLHFYIHNLCGKAVQQANGNGGYALCDSVCIAKAAARLIRAGLT